MQNKHKIHKILKLKKKNYLYCRTLFKGTISQTQASENSKQISVYEYWKNNKNVTKLLKSSLKAK